MNVKSGGGPKASTTRPNRRRSSAGKSDTRPLEIMYSAHRLALEIRYHIVEKGIGESVDNLMIADDLYKWARNFENVISR